MNDRYRSARFDFDVPEPGVYDVGVWFRLELHEALG